jgi:hypothetical protein
MKKIVTASVFLIACVICAFSADVFQGTSAPQQQNYTGTFTMVSGDVQITLTLKQEDGGRLTGTLESNNGSRFTLEGAVEYGVASGLCSNEQGNVFFEAYLDGNDLTLSLIEADAYNMPDYDSAQYLVLSRGSRQVTPGAQALSPMDQLTGQAGKKSQSVPAPAQAPSGFPVAAKGSEKVSDEISGYTFTKPAGWNHQLAEGYILLGSNTIPGLILTFPHQSGSMQAMIQEMGTGIQEEGINLALSSQVKQQSASLATCYFTGIVQGEQAKAYGVGVLGENGGGIFVLAVSTPEKLGNEIIAAANTIGVNTTFVRPKTGDQELVRHFSGEWAWSNGYRTEWMMFYPDGSFSDQYEAAYSGNTSDGWGNQTGSWGAANQSKSRGRWNIQGTRDAGVITVISPDGSQTRYEYSVFVERGQKYYREYMINGYHYTKNKDF